MARFIFSMQKILDMKEKLEKQEKNNFSQANLRLLEAQEELQKLLARQQLAQERLRETVSELADVQEIRNREEALEIVKMYARQQELIVLQRQKEVEVARKRMQEAMRERKTFEKLREKAYEQFMIEENLKEQKEIDELVSYRHSAGQLMIEKDAQ